MAFVPGDIAAGGVKHYVEVLTAAGTLKQMLHILDDSGNDTQSFITGVTFRPSTNQLFTTSTPSLTQDNAPHDVDWIPDDSGLLVAVVPTTGVLKFRKYTFDGAQLDEWTPAVEPEWARQSVKISVACDARTVFYTSSLAKIQRFDIVSGTQLSDYQTLPSDSPYIFGGLRVLPLQSGETAPDDYDVVVAMTLSGDGPQQAVCLAKDGSSFWVDEVNPSGGTYHLQQRALLDKALIQSVVTQADVATPTPANDRTISLACNFNGCSFPGLSRYSGAAGIGGVAIYGPPL